MAAAAVAFLLENLKGRLAEPRSSLISSALRDEIKGILEDLERMGELVRAANATQADEAFRHCVMEIRNLTYEVEDVLDYTVKVLKGECFGQIIRRFTGKLDDYLTIHRVAVQIRNLRSRSRRLINGLKRYSVSSNSEAILGSGFEEYIWLNAISYQMSVKDLVGMDKDTNMLVSYLVGKDRNYPVISICGMRGSGKTAIAEKISDHPEVRQNFERIAMVHLAQKFERKTILQDILKQLISPDEETIFHMDQDIELSQLLYKVLQKKHYLVILDDIRSLDAWEILRTAIPLGETTSKIILTTRMREVAETVAGQGYIHMMNCLTEDEGWDLFKREAFVTADPDLQAHGMIEVIGRGTVRRCRGIPLAIRLLGGLMATKQTLSDWEIFYQNIDSHLKIGDLNTILQVLAASLDNLPYHLKQCFLYLSYSPEESEIEVEKLHLLWMSEGIITSQKESTRDIAEGFLSDMKERGLVELLEEEVQTFGRYKSCRVNGLMRELCLLKAKQEEFIKVIDFGRGSQGVPDSISFDSTTPAPRLAIYLDEYKDRCPLLFTHETAKFLRCLVISNAHVNKKGLALPQEISDLSHFRVLRILDFDGVDFRKMKLPQGIPKLQLLKYLSFKGCWLEALPRTVSSLSCLQVLDLRVQPWNKLIIPNVLWKLKRLRHLYLPQTFQMLNHDKLRVDSLGELETLENFNTMECSVKDLFKVKNLRHLAVNTVGSVEDLKRLVNLMQMTREHILYTVLDVKNFDCYTEERHSVFRELLGCWALHTLMIEGHICRIPPYSKISQSLTEIILSGSELKQDPMLAFGELPKLQVLVLNDDAFQGVNMVCSESSFQELRRLELSNLHSLEKWRIENGALSKLLTLTIESCRRLETLPDGLEFVLGLREFKIRKMPRSFQDKVGQELHMFPHLPPIIYEN